MARSGYFSTVFGTVFGALTGKVSRRLASVIAALSAPPGGLTSAATRFGEENAAYMFSGANSATVALGNTALGPDTTGLASFRGIQLPDGHAPIPASGDQWTIIFFRTAASGHTSASGRQEWLLAVSEGADGNTPGGGFKFTTAVGQTGTGATVHYDPGSGLPTVARQASSGSWGLWKVANEALSAFASDQIQPNTAYCLIIGTRDLGTTDGGSLYLVRCSDGHILGGGRVDASSTSTKSGRPASGVTSVWNQIGALGAPSTGVGQANAKWTPTVNPSAGDTLTIGTQVITFVASGATGLQCNIGAAISNTLTNLAAVIQANTSTLGCTASASSTALTITGSGVGYLSNILNNNSGQLLSTGANAQATWSKNPISSTNPGTSDRKGFGGSVSDYCVAKGNAGSFPTAAQAQAIAQAQVDLTQLASYMDPGATLGVTVQYYNRLDASTASGGAIAPTIGTGNATLVGSVTAGAPIRQASRVTLNHLGQYWVFPLALGQSSGTVWLEGKAPAGATVEGWLKYLDSSISQKVTAVADGSGNYALQISSPGGKPFTRYVHAANDSQNFIDEHALMDVGLVVPFFGQSEMYVQFAYTAQDLVTYPGNSSPATSGGSGATLGQPGNPSTGPWAAVLGQAARSTGGTAYTNVPTSSAKPQPNCTPHLMWGSGFPGDGITEMAQYAINALSLSVMFIPIGRSGTPCDALVFDQLAAAPTTAPTVSGSGTGPYTLNLTLTQAEITRQFGSSCVLYPSFLSMVQPGTVTLTLPGGMVIQDVSGGSPSAGTMAITANPGAQTITSSSINYMTGAVSITFGSAQSWTGYTAAWTVKQETEDGTYLAQSGAGIAGFTMKDSVARLANNGLRFGATVAFWWWWTANISDASPASALAASMAAKMGIARTYLATFCRSGVAAALSGFPMIVAPKARDSQYALSTSGATDDAADYARNAAKLIWAETGSAQSQTWAKPGCWSYDNQTDATSSPHQAATDNGGRRLGRKHGTDLAAAHTGVRATNRGPSWGAPVFSTNTCTIPATLYGGTALAVASGGSATALDGWYVNGALCDNSTNYTVALSGSNVVITKIGGNFAGTETIKYALNAPGGTVAAPLASLVYDNRGGFGGFEPGLLADPIW